MSYFVTEELLALVRDFLLFVYLGDLYFPTTSSVFCDKRLIDHGLLSISP